MIRFDSREKVRKVSYESRALANAILDLADELRISLTHMAVHKIIYHAHGWRLAETGLPLVSEPFEAWEHGPVLPSIYGALKYAGKQPVSGRATRFNPATGIRSVARADVLPEDRVFLRNMLRTYGPIHAFDLSDMTHRRGGPWDSVWNAKDGKINLGMRIPNDAIRADFLGAGGAVGYT
jgi:uncharacterized phage-associated protein